MVLLIIMRAIIYIYIYKVCNNAWYIINNLSLSILEGLLNTGIIVFRPGPVQGPGSGFWSGHRVNSLFLKLKRHRFSKKKKVNGSQLSFWPGHAEFFLLLFFLQPGLARVGSSFKTMIITIYIFSSIFKTLLFSEIFVTLSLTYWYVF